MASFTDGRDMGIGSGKRKAGSGKRAGVDACTQLLE